LEPAQRVEHSGRVVDGEQLVRQQVPGQSIAAPIVSPPMVRTPALSGSLAANTV